MSIVLSTDKILKTIKLIILFITLFFSMNLQDIDAKDNLTVEIIPLGQIDNAVLDYLKENLGEIFNASVSIGQTQYLPEYAFDKKRGQYLSSIILKNLLKLKKKKNQKILATIDKDLYVPELNFVFGEADSLNGICIIALVRLHQSYYGLMEDKDLFLNRSLKEAVHEIGHLFNLRHCPDAKCVMHFSNSLLDTDIKDYHFCSDCKKRLSR